MEMMTSDQDWWGLALLRSFVHKNEVIYKKYNAILCNIDRLFPMEKLSNPTTIFF